jgi:hypothetical protein
MTQIHFGLNPPCGDAGNEPRIEAVILELRNDHAQPVSSSDPPFVNPRELIVHRLRLGDKAAIERCFFTVEPNKDGFGHRVVSKSWTEKGKPRKQKLLNKILCCIGDKTQYIVFTGNQPDKESELWFSGATHIPINATVRIAVHDKSFSGGFETANTLIDVSHTLLTGTDSSLTLMGVELRRSPSLIEARLPEDEEWKPLARFGRPKQFPNPMDPNTILLVSAVN